MNPDPLVRVSFWTVTFGLTTTWISQLGVTQSSIQRFLAVPDIRLARRSVWIFAVGLVVIKACSCFTGLLIYAQYETCDPVSTGVIKKLDQILPYYVMDIAGKIPGLPGLFIAGIFSAALSSMSSSLNTLAGTIYEDFLRPRFPDASEKFASNVMKVLVVVIGIIELSLVFVCEHLDTVFAMTLSLAGLTAGTLLGIFTIGMILPKANTTGVIAGAVSSMVFMLMIIIGAQSIPKGSHLEYRTDGCDSGLLNSTVSTVTSNTDIDVSNIPWLFKISMMYYSLLGFILVFLIGYPISLMTGGGNNETDEILLTPLFRSSEYKRKQKEDRRAAIYYAGINPTQSSAKLLDKEIS